MKNQKLAVILAVIIILSISIGGFLLYFNGGGGAVTSSITTPPIVQTGSAAISSANVTSTYGTVSLTIKNTGTATLVGLGPPSISPSEGDYCYTWAWNPVPATTNPVNSGGIVTGTCTLDGTSFGPGFKTTVSVTATFSNGSESILSTAVTVTK
jgi:hypothetical protein